VEDRMCHMELAPILDRFMFSEDKECVCKFKEPTHKV